MDQQAEGFYREALEILNKNGVPYLVGGAWALRYYAGIVRDTKDLDIFCRPGEYPQTLQVLGDAGFSIELTNPTWLAKARDGDYFVDVIFASANGLSPVDDEWFLHARPTDIVGCDTQLAPAEEILWQKMHLLDRFRFDGADVNHIIRKQGPDLDWQRLLKRMDPTWEVLLAHLILFGFVYPSEPHVVPQDLLQCLLERVQMQVPLPDAKDLVCRGLLIAKTQYGIDIEERGYRSR